MGLNYNSLSRGLTNLVCIHLTQNYEEQIFINKKNYLTPRKPPLIPNIIHIITNVQNVSLKAEEQHTTELHFHPEVLDIYFNF